jgi:hypothetical protein
MKPKLKPPGTKRLKVKFDILLSTSAYKFIFRRYIKEIYDARDLKLNLKFEMERLFKHLDVELKDIKPSYLLNQRVRERAGNPDFVVGTDG